MEIDEIAYLDQLYETAYTDKNWDERLKAQQQFTQIILRVWPEISKAFEHLKASV